MAKPWRCPGTSQKPNQHVQREFQRDGCGCPFPIPGTTQLDERFEKHQKKRQGSEKRILSGELLGLFLLCISLSPSQALSSLKIHRSLWTCVCSESYYVLGLFPLLKKNQKTFSYIWNIWGIWIFFFIKFLILYWTQLSKKWRSWHPVPSLHRK